MSKKKTEKAVEKVRGSIGSDAWRIYWKEYTKDTYLYGSQVAFHAPDDVEFRNELMPPGTVIKRWYSKTNFQSSRIEPALPMIDGEGQYRIGLYCDEDKDTEVFLRIVYFDRYDNEIDSRIIRDRIADFKCPITTYSYEVQLVGAGIVHIHFHSIAIAELTESEDGRI